MRATDLIGPVVVHSADTIQYANQEFCSLIGVASPSEVSQRPLNEFIEDAYVDRLQAQYEHLITDETPTLGLEIELDNPDGTTADVIAVSSLIEWEGVTQIHTSFIVVSGTPEATSVSLRERAMHQAPVGITIADATREHEPLIYVNDGFVELTGYPRDEVLGKDSRFLHGQGTTQESIDEMRRAIDAGEPVTVEVRNYRKEGSMFWNQHTITPIYDETGTLTHFFGFLEDITDEKVYEQEKTLFEEHAEASDQMMFIMDAEGTIEYVNPAFERVMGYSEADVIGDNHSLLQSDEQDEGFYEELSDTIEVGDTLERTLTNRTKSGELLRVHQTIVPVTNNDGEVTHLTAIERDISEERIKRQVLDVLDRVFRHNVRTAVNVIDGYADLLDTDPGETDRRAATRVIRNQTNTLKQISDQLDAVRQLLQEPADQSPLRFSQIEKIVSRFRDSADAATLSLTMDADGDDMIQNGGVMQLALEAAIENAIEHSDREMTTVDITVSHSESDDTAVIEIADNGPGVPESEWEIVTAGVETPLQHTSGIGLWILYWSVTTLGGTVELRENEPRGTIFTLEVPVTASTEDCP